MRPPFAATPEPSASATAGDVTTVVVDNVETFWTRAWQWFLGVPLQIMIIIVITLVVIAILHHLINRTVRKVVAAAERRAALATTTSPQSAPVDAEPGTSDGSHLIDAPDLPVPPAPTPADGLGLDVLSQRGTQRANAIGSLLRSVVSVTASGIALLTILPLLGIDIAPLLTSAGVLGVALGFGAQNLVKDYLSGIFIVLEDQYGVGDTVELAGVVGVVEDVTLRVTKMRDLSGIVWYVRNGEILTVANRSQGWTLAMADIPVGPNTDLDDVRSAVEQVATAMMAEPSLHASLLGEPTYAGVESVSGEAIVVRVVARAAAEEQVSVSRELRERLKAAFDAAGITIPVVMRLPGVSPSGGAGGNGNVTKGK